MVKKGKRDELFTQLDNVGLKDSIKKSGSVFIKVNLARPAEPGHPRTDTSLLTKAFQYIYENQGVCTIGESANGYLYNNLEQAGLGEIIKYYKVNVVDLDNEDVDKVVVNDEEHFLPKCLKDFGVRIAIPATSKRPGMIFSNNVKLFVGIVPRRMYQLGDAVVSWRPRIHVDLHKSVANVYKAVQEYAPFKFYINGGLAMDELMGEFLFKNILVGDDAVELDLWVLREMFGHHEIPEYIKILSV